MSSLNEEVKRIETIYKEEKDYNQIEKKNSRIERKYFKLWTLCENLTKISNKINFDIQIAPDDIKKYPTAKSNFFQNIELYKSFIIEEKTLIYWGIPFNNEKGKSIIYKNNFHIIRGNNNNNPYIRIEEIDDGFNINFPVIYKVTKSNKNNNNKDNTEIKNEDIN